MMQSSRYVKYPPKYDTVGCEGPHENFREKQLCKSRQMQFSLAGEANWIMSIAKTSSPICISPKIIKKYLTIQSQKSERGRKCVKYLSLIVINFTIREELRGVKVLHFQKSKEMLKSNT